MASQTDILRTKMMTKWIIFIFFIILMSFIKEEYKIDRYILLTVFSVLGLGVYFLLRDKIK